MTYTLIVDLSFIYKFTYILNAYTGLHTIVVYFNS